MVKKVSFHFTKATANKKMQSLKNQGHKTRLKKHRQGYKVIATK